MSRNHDSTQCKICRASCSVTRSARLQRAVVANSALQAADNGAPSGTLLMTAGTGRLRTPGRHTECLPMSLCRRTATSAAACKNKDLRQKCGLPVRCRRQTLDISRPAERPAPYALYLVLYKVFTLNPPPPADWHSNCFISIRNVRVTAAKSAQSARFVNAFTVTARTLLHSFPAARNKKKHVAIRQKEQTQERSRTTALSLHLIME